MLVGPGQVVTYLYWVTHVQQLGYGDTSTPGQHERRTEIVEGEYYLQFWNGSEWKKINPITAQEVLNKLLTVDGAASGVDADKLDGQEGTFYQDAGNLTAGVLSLDRIPSTLTGKSADTLDGNEGSFYRNSSNQNAGTLPRARLGDLFRCNDDGVTANPYMQSGTAKVFSPTAGPHTFDYAFTSSVSVVAASTTLSKFCSVVTTSTTNFNVRHGTDSGYANWFAIGSR